MEKKNKIFLAVGISILALTVLAFAIVCFIGINQNNSVPVETNLELTFEMTNEIKEMLTDEVFIAQVYFIRGLVDDKSYSNINISSHEQTSPTTYEAYGKIRSTDKYGDSKTSRIKITFTAKEVEISETNSKGYEIDWVSNVYNY